MPCFVAAALDLCWTLPSAVAGPIQKQMLLVTLSQWLSLGLVFLICNLS